MKRKISIILAALLLVMAIPLTLNLSSGEKTIGGNYVYADVPEDEGYVYCVSISYNGGTDTDGNTGKSASHRYITVCHAEGSPHKGSGSNPASYKLPGADTVKKDWYVLSGWSTKPDGYQAPGYNLEASNSHYNTKTDGSGWGTANFKCLGVYYSNATAAWTEMKMDYYITYNANGGSGAPNGKTAANGMVSQTTDHSASITVVSATPTRTGYVFNGWNTKKDGSGTAKKAGDKVTVNGDGKKTECTTTLYAQWKPASRDYKLTYEKGTTDTVSNMPANYEEKGSTKESIQVTVGAAPSRNGYKFVNWKLSNGTTFAPGTKITLDTNYPQKTLTAVWEAATTKYSIKYNLDGGTNGPSEMSITANVSATFTLSSTAPTKAGYTFKGWKCSVDKKTYQKGASVTLYANPSKTSATATFTAQWEKTPVTYRITFNGNGSGSGNIPAALEQKDLKQASCEFTIPATTPTRSGYKFLGWSQNKNATTGTYKANDKITLTANGAETEHAITLYAIWQSNATPTPTATPRPTATVRPTATARPTAAATARPTTKPTSAPVTQAPKTQSPATTAPTETPSGGEITGPTYVLDPLTGSLSDGMRVLMYNVGTERVLASKKTMYKDLFTDQDRYAIESTATENNGDNTLKVSKNAVVLTVEVVNADSNTYSFKTEDGKYLFCDGTNMDFVVRDKSNKNYTLFVVEKVKNDEYTIKSKASEKKSYLMGEGDYFTSDDLDKNSADFIMKFYTKHGEPVVIATPEPEPETKTLLVRVVDEYGLPISGVRIALYDKDKTPVNSDVTENDGKISFVNVACGNYYIGVFSVPDGYASSTDLKDLTITESWNDSAIIDIVIKPVPATPAPTEESEPTKEPVVEETPVPVATQTPVTKTGAQSCGKINWILIAGIGGGALLLAILITLLVVKKKKSGKDDWNATSGKKSSMENDYGEDGDEEYDDDDDSYDDEEDDEQ